MKKHFKKLVGPLVSIFFLLNMTSTGFAETTVSAEVDSFLIHFYFWFVDF